MKKFLLLFGMVASVSLVYWAYIEAADHIDAPAVTDTTSDITDIYAFESPANPENLVMVCNIQGLLSPGETASASFDEQVLLEFNIDNDGDNLEDLVIQCIFDEGKMVVYGPIQPAMVGLKSELMTYATKTSVQITSYGDSPMVGMNSGIKIFAGPRDDPFFFDLTSYNAVLAGDQAGFNDPGTDTFAGTNVLSAVVEVPKSMLGGADVISVWCESKREI